MCERRKVDLLISNVLGACTHTHSLIRAHLPAGMSEGKTIKLFSLVAACVWQVRKQKYTIKLVGKLNASVAPSARIILTYAH